MRVLLILISFLLVGCAKEPTYLKCDKTFSDVKEDSDDRSYWIVLDHQNSLWITSRQKQQNQEFYVYVNTLRTDGNFYWGGMEKRLSLRDAANKKAKAVVVGDHNNDHMPLTCRMQDTHIHTQTNT